MSKSEERRSYKTLLANHFAQANELAQSQSSLVQNCLQRLQSQTGTWGLYAPMAQEASLLELRDRRPELQWVFPRIVGQNLEFCLPEVWETGDFGIKQPAQGCEVVQLRDIRGIFIPGLAFDRFGNRLGRGKGFYDRALQGYSGLKIGVGFSFQLAQEELSTESHDVKMDCIITSDQSILVNPK